MKNTMALFGLTTLSGLSTLGQAGSKRAPAMFVGHGSPMNLIDDNTFTRAWKRIGKQLQQDGNRPQAILVISAHWQSAQTKVSTSANPETIYDFHGFPQDLYEMTYPAPGVSNSLSMVQSAVQSLDISADPDYGLDHGAWAVLQHLFADASIPVFQLSLGRGLDMQRHYDLGTELAALRVRGVMILASGNMIHNLRAARLYRARGEEQIIEDWAQAFDADIVESLNNRNHKTLIEMPTHARGC